MPLDMNVVIQNNVELKNEILSRGGLIYSKLEEFPTQYISMHIASLFDWYNRDVTGNHRIYWGWVNNLAVGAFSYTEPNSCYSFIGINIGSVYTIFDIFHRLMSDGEFLQDIGAPSQEVPFTENDYVDWGQTCRGFYSALPRISKCPIRTDYASILVKSCIGFLIFHEITHIVNGHCKMHRILSGCKFINENVREISDEQHYLFQSMEMDADSAAVGWVIKCYLDFSNFDVQMTQFAGTLDIAFGNAERCLRTLTLVTYAFLRAFDHTNWDFTNDRKSSHPMAPIRQYLIILNLFERIKFNQMSALEWLYGEHSWFNTIAEIERSFARVSDRQIDTIGIDSVLKMPVMVSEYLQRLFSGWNELWPKLNELKMHDRPLAPLHDLSNVDDGSDD